MNFIKDENILNSYKQGLYFYQLQEVWTKNGRSDLLETYKENLGASQKLQKNLAVQLETQVSQKSQENLLDSAQNTYFQFLSREVLTEIGQDFQIEIAETKVQEGVLSLSVSDKVGEKYAPLQINLQTGAVQGASWIQEDGGFGGKLHIAYQKAVNYLKTTALPSLASLVQEANQVDRKEVFKQAQKTEEPLETLSSLEKEAMQEKLENSLPNPLPIRAALQRSLLNLQVETKQMQVLGTILRQDL